MNTLILTLTTTLLLACTTPKSIQNQSIASEQPSSQPSPSLKETYWKLVEINGKAFKSTSETREPHLILKTEDNRIIGHSGCNRYFGTYAQQENQRLSFGNIGSTKMACLDDDNIEFRFFDVLGRTDSYTIKGDTLSLHRARMTPLAKFVAVHVH